MNQLLQGLSQVCFLKSLAIPKCKLNEVSSDLLCQIISKSAPNLTKLDISWNELSSSAMSKIFSCLELNRKL